MDAIIVDLPSFISDIVVLPVSLNSLKIPSKSSLIWYEYPKYFPISYNACIKLSDAFPSVAPKHNGPIIEYNAVL